MSFLGHWANSLYQEWSSDLKDLEGRDGRKCVLTCVDL